MLTFIAHDITNDVAIIKTQFGISVRYGLQVTKIDTMHEAVGEYESCVRHAISCGGQQDVYPNKDVFDGMAKS